MNTGKITVTLFSTASMVSLLLSSAVVKAQGQGSLAGYYRNPLDIEMILSANFGETRANHFHSGIDIKTQGAEGKPVYAAADGYISRVGVSPSGFGRVLYIAHPNGTTTVYGHMRNFTEAMEDYAASERYRLNRHSADLYPDAIRFRVKKGDLIGYSGNSGGSAGPHLHFEVRDGASQKPLNLLARGVYDVRDDIPPTIVRLHYIEVDTVNGVPLNSRPRAIEVVKVRSGVFAPADTAAFRVGRNGYFVLEVTNRKNGADNTMGIYSVSTSLDGSQLFSFALDGFLFSDTRYVNSLCHYAMQRGKRNQMIRTAVQENNLLPVYGDKTVSRGAVVTDDDKRHVFTVKVEDDNRNTSQLSLTLVRRKGDTSSFSYMDTEGIPVECGLDFKRSIGDLSITIPAGALYESIYYRQTVDENPAMKGGSPFRVPRWSPLYIIHDAEVPLHKRMAVSVRVQDVPEQIKPRLCLAVLSPDGAALSYAGGSYQSGRVGGEVAVFGKYCVVADTIPPTLEPPFANGQNLAGKKSFSFTVRDDFSGIAFCTAAIDGKWILLEQKNPGAPMVHHFDPSKSGVDFNGRSHSLVITVTDNAGNSSTLKRSFVR